MAKKTELDEPAIYYIPNNFIAKGTVLGGTFKTRNVIEAIALLLIIGYPIMSIHMNITIKIVLLCILAVAPAIAALIGVNDGPLSQFLIDFIKFKKFPHEYEYDLKHSNMKNDNIENVGEKSETKSKEKSKIKAKKKGGRKNEKKQ